MSDSERDIRTMATRFFDALEQGDVDTVADTYAEGVLIWHNTDQLATTKAENIEVLRNMVRRSKHRRYTERQLNVFAGGFVQRHVLRAERIDGYQLELHACIVCAVEDGKITRLDEYFDSAVVNAWRSDVKQA